MTVLTERTKGSRSRERRQKLDGVGRHDGNSFPIGSFVVNLYWRRRSRYGRRMRGSLCGSLSLSVSIVAAVQLAFVPASRAQNAPAPAAPEVNTQDSNVAAPPPGMPGPPAPPGPPPAYGPIVTV